MTDWFWLGCEKRILRFFLNLLGKYLSTTSHRFWTCKSIIGWRKVHKINFKIPGFGSAVLLGWLLFWKQGSRVISQNVPQLESLGSIPCAWRTSPAKASFSSSVNPSLRQRCCKETDPVVGPSCRREAARLGIILSGITRVLKKTFLWLSKPYWHLVNCLIYDKPHQPGTNAGKIIKVLRSFCTAFRLTMIIQESWHKMQLSWCSRRIQHTFFLYDAVVFYLIMSCNVI